MLADFASAVITETNKLWPGKMPLDYVPNDWNYQGMLTHDEWKQVWSELMKVDNLWLKLPPLPGTLDLFDFLQKNQTEVFYVTSRGVGEGFSVLTQTTLWLTRHRLYNAGAAVIPVEKHDEKVEIVLKNSLPFFLDDYAPTVELLRHAGVNAYLLDKPYNRYAYLPRVHSVAEYLDIVKKESICLA